MTSDHGIKYRIEEEEGCKQQHLMEFDEMKDELRKRRIAEEK